MKTITAKQLRKLRESAGLTQKQAAEITGIGKEHWCSMENGIYGIKSVYSALIWAYIYLPVEQQLVLLKPSEIRTAINKLKPQPRKTPLFTKTKRTIMAHDLIIRSKNGVSINRMMSYLKCSQATLYRMKSDLMLLNKNIYIEDKTFKFHIKIEKT